jgi:hypothetical protein
MTTEIITLENTNDIIQEIETAFWDIPFENSDFQNEMFVVAAQITPERAYRAIGLRMNAKLRALNEAKYGRMLEDIDIEEIEEQLNSGTLDKFEARRKQIELAQKREARNYTNKLINDAIRELSCLYKHFKALPKYTREQFEAGEKVHFQQSLTRQTAGISGAIESLININEDMAAIEQYEQQVALLDNISTEQLSQLLLEMPNKISQQ